MTNRHPSLLIHSIYVLLTGLQLIFVPNMLLSMFGFEPTSEIWIKVLGIVVLSLTFIYYAVSKSGNTQVVSATAMARALVGAGFLLLALTGQAKINIILFAGIDIATAAWTWWELQKQKS
jgi:hypothetical protein